MCMKLISELNTALLNALSSEGAFMGAKKSVSSSGRDSFKDFIVVPMEQDKDGNPQYACVALSMFKSKSTEKTVAFDPDEAVATFEEHCEALVEKASKPKSSSSKKSDPAAAERKAKRLDALREVVANFVPGEEYNATMVYETVDHELFPTVMMVGQLLGQLVADASLNLNLENHDNKNWYSIQ